ncbi:hypothetical protein [Parafrankia sp. FMc2]|uniref:hypothetical protein n=1 Tax=Parafrankia sp. FMc2 TaxID=3233196 RepID=UPI0034D58DF6
MLRFVRPWLFSLLVGKRMWLSLRLSAAAYSGCLLWFGVGTFAIVEGPLVTHGAGSPGWRARVVRLALRNWELVVFTTIPLIATMLAYVCALAYHAGVQPSWLFGYSALFICVAIMCWALMHMIMHIPIAFITFLGILEHKLEVVESRAIDLYRQENWTLLLLHVEDPLDVPQVLGAARRKIADTELFLCVERGITTTAARAAAAGIEEVARLDGDLKGILVLRARGHATPLRKPLQQMQGTVQVLLLMALPILAFAWPLASVERDACNPDKCEGRPESYLEAVLWLAYRTVFQKPDGIDVGTSHGHFMSIAFPIQGLIMLSIIIKALYDYYKSSKGRAQPVSASTALRQ